MDLCVTRGEVVLENGVVEYLAPCVDRYLAQAGRGRNEARMPLHIQSLFSTMKRGGRQLLLQHGMEDGNTQFLGI